MAVLFIDSLKSFLLIMEEKMFDAIDNIVNLEHSWRGMEFSSISIN